MAISDLTLAGLTRTQLLEMHYKMALLRRFEEKSAEEYTRGKIGGFMPVSYTHLTLPTIYSV